MKGSPDLRLNLPRKSALEINIHYRLLGGRHSSHIAETTVVALTLGRQVSTYRQIKEKKNPFSNFALQKRSAILAMLLLAGYYILLLVYLLVLTADAAVVMLPAMFLPLIALASNAVAFTLVRKQEAKIIAKALGFRLRD